MATAEAETARDDRSPPVRLVYDGFISYSHAADDLLAPRLQAGLQRFAKPWWKRRALRIFRDEASLSASPHLWSSITDALDNSAWFVLLLSPDAAESPWVNDEVEYWLANKDGDRIIPVITDGEFGWSSGDVAGDVVPPALRGAFSDEPRWVDLRFAHTEEQLDLSNPRFSGVIADIAAPMRGVPKDELESEEVRQHRRTVRTAWAAGIALLALVVVASGAAVFAIGQQNRANDEATRASELAQQEAAARQDAEEQQQVALAAADAEAEQRAVARARELAASALGALDRDPELALLLTLSSFNEVPPEVASFPEGTVALREALDSHRLLATVSGRQADFAADGQDLVVSESDQSVSLLDLDSGDPVWTYRDATTIDSVVRLEVSGDGRHVALLLHDGSLAEGDDPGEVVVDDDGNDPYPARVVVLDALSGSRITTINGSGCPGVRTNGATLFSPDGSLLSFPTGTPECFDEHTAAWTSVIDTTTWQEVARAETVATGVTFPATLDTALIVGSFVEAPPDEIDDPRVVAWPAGETTQTISFPATDGLLFPDGTKAVLRQENNLFDNRPAIADTQTGAIIDRLDGFEGFVGDLAISPDGDRIAAAGSSGVYVWRPNGELLHHFPSPLAAQIRFSRDGQTVVSSHIDDIVRLWDIAELSGTPVATETFAMGFFNPDTIIEGVNTGIVGFSPEFEVGFAQLDPATGATIHGFSALFWADQLPDGRFLLVLLEDDATGPLVLWNPADESFEVIDDCELVETDDGALCPNGEPRFGPAAVVSLDGRTIGAMEDRTEPGGPWKFRLWDVATLEPTRTIELEFFAPGIDRTPFLDDRSLVVLELGPGGESPGYVVFDVETGDLKATLDDAAQFRGASAVSPTGDRLYLGSWEGVVYEYDTATWMLLRSWQAQDGRMRGLAMSPDGSQILSTGEDGYIMIWDLESLQLADRIPMPFPSDAMWVDSDTLGVALGANAEWKVVTLRQNELLDQARNALTRSYTDDECRLYGIDPCPTLEDIKTGSA